MARKNVSIDTNIINASTASSKRGQGTKLGNKVTTSPPLESKDAILLRRQIPKSRSNPRDDISMVQDNSEDETRSSKQTAEPNTLTRRKVRILPVSNSLSAKGNSLALLNISRTPTKLDKEISKKPRGTPARSAKKPTTYRNPSPIDLGSDVSDIEESIWCEDRSDGSESEIEEASDFASPVHWPGERINAMSPAKKGDTSIRPGSPLRPAAKGRPTEIASLPGQDISVVLADLDLSDQENRPPPPRVQAPPLQAVSLTRPSTPPPTSTTPPPSPSKSRLNSPSKKKFRIPTPPGRPSLDTFWDAQQINSWHDVHSPKKPLLSPSKHRFFLSSSTTTIKSSDASAEPDSPSASPRKSPTKPPPSPRKTKAELAARKAWDDAKEGIATSFLAELDARITDGAIGRATASTGGVKLVWSKTLNSTAGRATWRRETVRAASGPRKQAVCVESSRRSATPESTVSASGSGSSTPAAPVPATMDGSALALGKSEADAGVVEVRHHATIELATKVLTDETRLYNTLAHEFCHLATYIVSGVKTRPHGAEFKAWGRKCSRAFREKGVEVTTKHGYAIEWKYLWVCAGVHGEGVSSVVAREDGGLAYEGGCGREYGRHSKSIDPAKSRCAGCKGKLVQVRPVPRAGNASPVKKAGMGGGMEMQDGLKTVGGFAGFVKSEFAGVKKQMGKEAAHGAVMEELGKRWRAAKETKNAAAVRSVGVEDELIAGSEDDVNNVVKAMEVIVIDD